MRRKVNPSRRRQKGAVALEGILTLVAFVALFLGAIDLAQVMMIHQGVVERVRFAARRAAVSCCNETAVKNMVLYGQTTAPSGTAGYFGLTPANVTVTFAAQNTPDQRVTIRVAGFQYTTYTPMLAGVSNGIPVQVSMPLELP